MVVKFRVNLRVDELSLKSDVESRGLQYMLTGRDGPYVAIVRVEGTIRNVMQLTEDWDIASEDIIAFWN